MKLIGVASLALILASVTAIADETSLGSLCKMAKEIQGALADYHDTIQIDQKPKYEDIVIALQTLGGSIDVAFETSSQGGAQMSAEIEGEIAKIEEGAQVIGQILTANRSARHVLISKHLSADLSALQAAVSELEHLACSQP